MPLLSRLSLIKVQFPTLIVAPDEVQVGTMARKDSHHYFKVHSQQKRRRWRCLFCGCLWLTTETVAVTLSVVVVPVR
jgi:hypothetical protein